MKIKYLKIFLSTVLFLSTFLLVQLDNQKRAQKILGSETKLKTDQETILAWEQILEERPDYRDGWVQLAAIYYKADQTDKARQALLKAKTLDPTNEVVLNFEKFLGE